MRANWAPAAPALMEVAKGRFALPRPYGHDGLSVARLLIPPPGPPLAVCSCDLPRIGKLSDNPLLRCRQSSRGAVTRMGIEPMPRE